MAQRLEVIGEGAMGTVYRAIDPTTGQILALKTLRRREPGDLLRLKDEFRVLAEIRHPNLVRLGELFVRDSDCHFTMEYVDGVSVVEFIRTGPDTEMAQRCRTALIQVAAALATLHGAGKLHGDVKPSNVLVDRHGRVVLLDFGLSREIRDADAEVGGTYAYMAPEVLHGMPPSEATDWYALGVVLYEAWSGQLPWQASELIARASGRPRSLRDRVRSVPPHLDELVCGLLDLAPASRAGIAEIRRWQAIGERDASREAALAVDGSTFVGREGEMAALREACASVAAGHPVVVAVEGVSGVGKTTFVRRALEILRAEQGVVVLESACRPREQVPFNALDGIVDGVARLLTRQSPERRAVCQPKQAHALARVFPVLDRVDGFSEGAMDPPADARELRRAAFDGLRELLVSLSLQTRLVLWVDDMHWRDRDSVGGLRDVLYPLQAPGMLLICSLRPSAADADLLADLLGKEWAVASAGDYRRITLGPLSGRDARQLVEATLASGTRDLVDSVVAESDGNPLLLTVLGRLMRSTSELAPRSDRLLADRIAALGADAIQVLEVLAVAGHAIPDAIVLDASGTGVGTLERLDELEELRLVRRVRSDDEVGVELYHDLVRVAVLESVSDERRRMHHARIAAALERAPDASAEVLVAHYVGAGEVEKAANYAYVAAERAADLLAFERAVPLYEKAIALGTDRAPTWQLCEKLGNARINGGYNIDGAHDLLRAATLLEGNHEDILAVLELRRRAAQSLLLANAHEEGHRVLRDVLAVFGLPYPATPVHAVFSLMRNRARLRLREWLHGATPAQRPTSRWEQKQLDVCWTAGVGFSIWDMLRAFDYQVRHALLANELGDARHMARACATEAQILAWEGNRRKRPRARRLAAQAADLAVRVADPSVDSHGELMRCTTAFAESRFDDAIRIAEESLPAARQRGVGVQWEIASMQVTYASSLAAKGEFARLWRALPRMLEEADELGDRFYQTMLRMGFLSLAWLAVDRPERAREQLLRATDGVSDNPWVVYQGRFSEGHIELYDGRPAIARARLAAGLAVLRRNQFLRLMMIRKFYVEALARCTVAEADDARDPRSLRRAGRIVRRVVRDDAQGLAAHKDLLTAAMLAIDGDRGAASRALQRAIAGFEADGMGSFAASARHALGRVTLGAAGDRLIEEASAWLSEHGVARPDRMATTLAPGFTRMR